MPSQLQLLLNRIRSKVESRSRRPWFDLQHAHQFANKDVVESPQELSAALSRFHLMLTESELHLIFSEFAPSHTFDFKAFANAVFPPENYSVGIEDSTGLRPPTGSTSTSTSSPSNRLSASTHRLGDSTASHYFFAPDPSLQDKSASRGHSNALRSSGQQQLSGATFTGLPLPSMLPIVSDAPAASSPSPSPSRPASSYASYSRPATSSAHSPSASRPASRPASSAAYDPILSSPPSSSSPSGSHRHNRHNSFERGYRAGLQQAMTSSIKAYSTAPFVNNPLEEKRPAPAVKPAFSHYPDSEVRSAFQRLEKPSPSRGSFTINHNPSPHNKSRSPLRSTGRGLHERPSTSPFGPSSTSGSPSTRLTSTAFVPEVTVTGPVSASASSSIRVL